jgi:hypothetical protein
MDYDSLDTVLIICFVSRRLLYSERKATVALYEICAGCRVQV